MGLPDNELDTRDIVVDALNRYMSHGGDIINITVEAATDHLGDKISYGYATQAMNVIVRQDGAELTAIEQRDTDGHQNGLIVLTTDGTTPNVRHAGKRFAHPEAVKIADTLAREIVRWANEK